MEKKLTMEEFYINLPQSLRVILETLELKVEHFKRINKQGEKYHWIVFLKNGNCFELFYYLSKDYTGWTIRLFNPVQKIYWERLENKSEIKKWNKLLFTAIENSICPRCFGTGKLEKFKHIKNGDCFKCNGKGIIIPKSEDDFKDVKKR
jgi:hypothetical protein